MLKHQNGIVYVNDEPTTNAELIGLAYLDMVERTKPSKEELKKQLLTYFRNNGRLTQNRMILTNIIFDFDVFVAYDIIHLCHIKEIKMANANVYNFLKDCEKAGVVLNVKQKYKTKKN